MPDRPDLLTQLERYGTVLDAEPHPEVDAEPGTVVLRPLRRLSPVPRHRSRTLLVAAAAVVALLAGVLALSRARGDLETSRLGDDRPATVDPSGPAISPRLVAQQPPSGLVPTAAFEGEGAPGLEPSPSDPSWRSTGESHASTVQAFSLSRGTAVPVPMMVVITPTVGVVTGGSSGEVRGVAAGEVDGDTSRSLSWHPPDANITALVPSDVPMSDLRAVVEALQARSDEVLAGFDAPAAPVGAWTVARRAEHVVPRGAPRELPVSRVWYHDPSDVGRVALLAGYGPVPGASPELVGTMRAGARRSVIAGAERVLTPSQGRTDWTTVTWLRPDGTQAVLTTKGLNDADIEALVGSVAPADPPVWDRVRAEVGTTLRAGHVVAVADLPAGRVEIYGDENRALQSLRGACLTVPGAAPRCSAIAPLADRFGGDRGIGAQGPLDAPVLDSAQFVTSLLVDGRWYGVGALPHLDSLTVTADGAPVEVASAHSTGNLTVFAAELPPTASRAEVSGGLGMQGPVATTPGEHLLGPFSVTLVRP